MTTLSVIEAAAESLPTLIDRACLTLTNARTSAEVLEAHDLAGLAYDAAKRAARVGKAKQAHDSIIIAAHRTQADALEIEARAKRRLADEYDAAQERGEISRQGAHVPDGNMKTADLGLSRKDIHEAREVRDAEEADPGIVRRTIDQSLKAGQEPTRAKVRRAVKAKSKRRRVRRHNPTSPKESQHDRDLRMLLGVWEAACESARKAFLKSLSQRGEGQWVTSSR